MPAYTDPKYKGNLKYATIDKPVYSFGYNNNDQNPQGPAAPAAPTIATFTNAASDINPPGKVFVTLTYVFPGSSYAQVNPQTLPQGFPSLFSNIAVTTGNQINIASPSASGDVGNAAIGYNVFAGFSNSDVNLVNYNSVIPIGTATTITSNAQINVATGGVTVNQSSRTNTYTFETISANATAGLQHAIPTSGSNFVGGKNISWKTVYGGTPAFANIALQVAEIDNNNSYVTIDYTTNTAGDFRIVNPVNAKFFRAYAVTVPAANIGGNLTTLGCAVTVVVD